MENETATMSTVREMAQYLRISHPSARKLVNAGSVSM